MAAARHQPARAGSNVLPLFRRAAPTATLRMRRFRVRAELDDGSVIDVEGAGRLADEVEGEVYDMATRRGRLIRRMSSRCMGMADGDTAWTDTLAPEQADEAGELLASRPSPFDALPGTAADRAALRTRRGAMATLHADKALIWQDRCDQQADDARALAAVEAVLRAAPADAAATAMAVRPLSDSELAEALADIDARAKPAPVSDWLHNLLPEPPLRHRLVFAWSFVLAIGSVLWWAGVLG